MCGIAGKIYFDSEKHVSENELRSMARVLAHRGPDGEGIWIDQNVGLAHRRLSIIDLSCLANQPMSNEDGSIWITFNGEIYNFQELRQTLEKQGHYFRTRSDTEVIVHAYEQYGRSCLTQFRGMFALAIWDRRAQKLFLASDRVGKKPLYYFHSKDGFLFASEIKALLLDPCVPREPDPLAIDHYLALGYIPAPLSAFRGIQKLPAAHWLELCNGRVKTERYWKLRYSQKRRISFRDAMSELRWHLAEAVQLRLRSDVPLGAFLSGGIDSSAVVASMATLLNRPVKTFTVGFEEAMSDERPFARILAERYGTDHTELIIRAPVAESLPRILWHYDEPFGDPSVVPSFGIAEATRQHVAVVLNGDGGDENFAGYTRYIPNCRAQKFDMIPAKVRRCAASLIGSLPGSLKRWRSVGRAASIADAIAQSPGRRYSRWFGQFNSVQREKLYTADFTTALKDSDPERLFEEAFANSDSSNTIDATLDVDVRMYLCGDLLVKMDRATMAHSLEARSPFLDHVFMEFVATLPATWKLAGKEQKYILKSAFRGIVPDPILDKPKQGFEPPLLKWFRDDLKDMTYDLVMSSRAIQRGYFTRQGLSDVFREHYSGREDRSLHLWELLIFELWNRIHVDGDA